MTQHDKFLGLDKDGEKCSKCTCLFCPPLKNVKYLSENAIICNCGCEGRFVRGPRRITEALKHGWHDLADRLKTEGFNDLEIN